MLARIPIIAIDIFENRLKLAKELGATHIFNSNNCDVFKEIQKLLNGGKVDIFIDNTGNTKIIENGYESIKDKGKLILVGVPRKGNNINIISYNNLVFIIY